MFSLFCIVLSHFIIKLYFKVIVIVEPLLNTLINLIQIFFVVPGIYTGMFGVFVSLRGGSFFQILRKTRKY